MKFHSLLSLVPALVLVGASDPAAGQTVPDTVAEATDMSTAIPLAPIRVTVLRSPLRLTETPYPVTVERPAGGGAGLSLADALGAVPGLQVDNRYNFALGDRLSVRGLGARAQFGVRGVKVLVDGIPATMPDGQTSMSHVDPRWVERAEVVRGPASSLWGNAAGGVIQLETPSSPLDGPLASISALAGSHGLLRYGADAGWGAEAGGSTSADPGGRGGDAGPPGMGVRASVSRLSYDGFRAHSAAARAFASARADWRGRAGALTVVAHGVSYEAENPGSLSMEALSEDPSQAYGFNVAQGTGESAEQAQLGVTWRRELGGVEAAQAAVLELTGWALTRSLDNPIPAVVIDLERTAAGARTLIRGDAT
ncbi:MAG: TonB-dependent receptor plug domain-containing protein, partial [Gemmatimonadota bacterium]